MPAYIEYEFVAIVRSNKNKQKALAYSELQLGELGRPVRKRMADYELSLS